MSNKIKYAALSALIAGSVASLGGCGGGDDAPPPAAAVSASGNAVAVTSDRTVITFDRAAPNVATSTATITGFNNANEVIIGMDVRPVTRQVYLVTRDPSNVGRVYTLDPATGQLSTVAQLIPDPNDTSDAYTALSGTSFGVNFNPVVDAMRIISDSGQNLRVFVNQATGREPGWTNTDTALSRTGTFTDTGTSYTNAFAGTTTTRQFSIDTTGRSLIQQTVPNAGTTVVAAPLFSQPSIVDAATGFDIDARNNLGYAVLTVAGEQALYTVAIPDATATLPLTAAAATRVGVLPRNNIVAMALVQPTDPVVVALDGSTGGTQRLLSFSLRDTTTATAVAVTGLPATEPLLSIDYRPSNQKIYGLTSLGRLVTINDTTGLATPLNTLSISSSITAGLAAGKTYSIDFNPAADALRIVSSSVANGGSSENYRVPTAVIDAGGTTLTDTPLAFDPTAVPTPSTFSISHVAYTNSFALPGNTRPSVTRMFDIDSLNSRVLQQTNPNGGTLAFRTALPATADAFGGLDFAGGDNGAAVAAVSLQNEASFKIFRLDLSATGIALNSAAGVVIGTGSAQGDNVKAVTIKY